MVACWLFCSKSNVFCFGYTFGTYNRIKNQSVSFYVAGMGNWNIHRYKNHLRCHLCSKKMAKNKNDKFPLTKISCMKNCSCVLSAVAVVAAIAVKTPLTKALCSCVFGVEISSYLGFTRDTIFSWYTRIKFPTSIAA